MIKTIVMALLSCAGMVAYDSATSKPTPTMPPTKQEQQQTKEQQQKINKHENSSAMALFVCLLPDRKTLPSPMQEFYLAVNL